MDFSDDASPPAHLFGILLSHTELMHASRPALLVQLARAVANFWVRAFWYDSTMPLMVFSAFAKNLSRVVIIVLRIFAVYSSHPVDSTLHVANAASKSALSVHWA